MEAGVDDFESWLSLKLEVLNIDGGVFGTYITGILEGGEKLEDKTKAWDGILAEIMKDDILHTVMKYWTNGKKCHRQQIFQKEIMQAVVKVWI